MAINTVTSTVSAPPPRAQSTDARQADFAKKAAEKTAQATSDSQAAQAEKAKQTSQAQRAQTEQAQEAQRARQVQQPNPVVNTQGQVTGQLLNEVA